MRLPRAETAVVDQQKIVGYLLNPAHPDNGGKAMFFQSLGFQRDSWETFATSLRQLAERGDVQKRVATAHGEKYIVDGRIESPSGKSPMIRTVWIVDAGYAVARLVTAYRLNE